MENDALVHKKERKVNLYGWSGQGFSVFDCIYSRRGGKDHRTEYYNFTGVCAAQLDGG